MQFNMNQERAGGHKNNLQKLDLHALESISVQNQLNEIEEGNQLKDSLGISSAGGYKEPKAMEGAGARGDLVLVEQDPEQRFVEQTENAAMLKSFLTEAKHSQRAAQHQKDLY